MTKSKAIKLKCLDCGGGSPKEVTLCHLFDCPLWPFRTGSSIDSKTYCKRMEAAFKNYKEDLKALQDQGTDIALFLPYGVKQAYREKNDTPKGVIPLPKQNRV